MTTTSTHFEILANTVSEHFTLTVPPHDALRALYDDAIKKINAGRGTDQLTTPWYAKIGDAIFKAGCLALSDAINDTRLLRAVPAPAGSGKTSFSYALIASVTRYAETHSDAPYGCAFVVDQITKADKVYRDLNKLLPGQVGIWTRDHDVNCKNPKRMKPEEMAARYSKADLQHKPVIVVTNKFYLDRNGETARNVIRNGLRCRRSLTVVDERPDEAPTLEITLPQAEAVYKKLTPDHPEAKEHLSTLLHLMQTFRDADPNKLFRPGIEINAAKLSRDLQWFLTDEAKRLALAYPTTEGVDQLFAFARAMAVGRGCISTDGSLTYYFGYETRRVIDVAAGTILLDATAAVDGVSSIVDWREVIETPPARYDNLEVIHVRQHTKSRLKQYFEDVDNRCDYARWMIDTILKHMSPGERGLVVCKEALFKNKNIPDWGQTDTRFDNPKNYTEGFQWNLEGRLLCATHYGTGIGSNEWGSADVVFLFDEHIIPRRIGAATTQGYRDQRVNEGALGDMKTINSRSKAIDAIVNGNAVRWTMQMALRGLARFYDSNGICGKQRLVIGCDFKRFSATIHKLFPRATIKYDKDCVDNSTLVTKVTELLRSCANHKVTTKQLSKHLGRPWRTISGKLLTDDLRGNLWPSLGWRYVNVLGRSGSYFQKILPTQSTVTTEIVPEDYGRALIDRCELVSRFVVTA